VTKFLLSVSGFPIIAVQNMQSLSLFFQFRKRFFAVRKTGGVKFFIGCIKKMEKYFSLFCRIANPAGRTFGQIDDKKI